MQRRVPDLRSSVLTALNEVNIGEGYLDKN